MLSNLRLNFKMIDMNEPVLTADQHLFAIAKRNKWKWSDTYSEHIFFWGGGAPINTIHE